VAKVIVGMTISLDEFVVDQHGSAGRLYPDLAALPHNAYMKDAIEQTELTAQKRGKRDRGTRRSTRR
jgi:hypothetical protein